jgi:hypothetical protein
MTPQPLILGLTICEKAIVETGTKNVTLVSIFTRFVLEEFPSLPKPFVLHLVLTGGHGTGIINVAIRELETDEEIYENNLAVSFADRAAEVYVLFRINKCSFPRPGKYQITLFLDGEWLAHRQIQVIERQALTWLKHRSQHQIALLVLILIVPTLSSLSVTVLAIPRIIRRDGNILLPTGQALSQPKINRLYQTNLRMPASRLPAIRRNQNKLDENLFAKPIVEGNG